MRKFLLAVFLSLALFTFGKNSVHAATIDEVSAFSSELTINQDTSLTISEKIDYQTNLDKHGIYRYLPHSYRQNGEKEVLNVSGISVTDGKGARVPFEKSTDSRFVTLKIGDPDRTFTGKKTYLIKYNVERAINQFPEHNELFWDITGEGWQIPVRKSLATVNSPFAEIVAVNCLSGAVGGNDELCTSQAATASATFTYNQEINYGDNFSVVVTLPKASNLIFPTPFELLMNRLANNWTIFLLPLPLGLIFYRWWKYGRDRQFISPDIFDLSESKPSRVRPLQFWVREPFVYAPLEDLTPGEAGALIDEKVDPQDVVAEILELARKKYLKIELIEEKVFFSKKRDYLLTKLEKKLNNLPEVQQFLLEKIFVSGEKVKISDLKGTFYKVIEEAKNKIEAGLVAKKVYTNKPSTTRVWGMIIFLVSFGVTALVVVGQFFSIDIFWPLPLLLVQLPLGLILAYNLPQKTAVGTNLWLQAKGLKKSIGYGKWREQIKEKNLFIEEVLPFAVALGVINQLAREMKVLGLEPPSYVGTTNLTTLSTAQFVSSFSTEVASTLSYNPSSSSSGGGFSGGGGGGGGGGSW